MKTINFTNIDNIKKELSHGCSVMYGAGGNGERIWKILDEHSIKIDYFCDDDYNKWGTYFCGIPVMSFDWMKEFSKKRKINIILTSVFAGPILGKLEQMDVVVYEPFSMLLDRYYQNSFYKVHLSAEQLDKFQRKVGIVAECMNDAISKEILGKISSMVKEPEEVEYSHFFNVASKEDCYFIKEVLDTMPKHPVIVDCGGFTGDLMVALQRHGIDYDKIYSFEANQELISIMQENIRRNSLEDKFIPINKGVWNVSGTAYLNVRHDDIAGGAVDSEAKGIPIDTVTIDDYFQNTKFDFVKMDIEGAELNAIEGGIGLIKKYRPIMAISLYHSVEDVVRIPLYLFKELEKYHYMIRHHSLIDSETVFYCIPDEKIK